MVGWDEEQGEPSASMAWLFADTGNHEKGTDCRRSGVVIVGARRVRVGRRQWGNAHEGLVGLASREGERLRREVHGGSVALWL